MKRHWAVILAVFSLGACTTEKIQYLTRPPFNPPPDATAGFLGYFTVSTQQTTCGNCHVDHQARWVQTKHAVAWATLQGSGHAAGFCNGCHTVSENGNDAKGPAGYNKVADSVYQDVQCENCHGPGVVHVTTPDNTTTIPLARLAIDTTSVDSLKHSCAACHTGTHEPFIQEWKASKHSQLVLPHQSEAGCNACHEGRAALAAWGVTAHYVEQNQVCLASGAGCLPTTCAVCHDPHGSPNAHQLRYPVNVADENTNLCMKCHSRRAQVVATSTRGPHAPQGPVLLGTAGWWPPGYVPDTSPTSHGTPAANPNLCAGCHVYRFVVLDTLTKAFSLQVAGHLFLPIPCLDASGAPKTDTTANSCPFPGDAGYVAGMRSFKACAASGCHNTETLATNAFVSRRQAVKALANVLWFDKNNNGVLDPYPTDTGYLAKIKAARPAEFTGATLTPAKGALFNAQLFGEGLAANGDRSFGVHNPFLADSLLRASASYLLTAYPGVVP
jgi:predicted CXXCH cytochrome family protein